MAILNRFTHNNDKGGIDLFSTIAFIVVGVSCLIGAFSAANIVGPSYKDPNPLVAWILVGLAVQFFIGAELSSIWRRSAVASEATVSALKEQIKLLKRIATGMPNAATAAKEVNAAEALEAEHKWGWETDKAEIANEKEG